METKLKQEDTETRQGILQILQVNQEKIRSFGVIKLGLFGSFARNEQTVESDIDLLVEFQQDKKTFDNFIHLNFFLEEALKRQVELVTTESLSPYVGPHIMKEVEYVTFVT